MKERFEGAEGNARLIEALKQHRIVLGDAGVASAFVEIGMLVEFEPNSVLLTQGEFDNHAFLLVLAGDVEVRVNRRSVAVRGAQELVGEMALIESVGSAIRHANLQIIGRCTQSGGSRCTEGGRNTRYSGNTSR